MAVRWLLSRGAGHVTSLHTHARDLVDATSTSTQRPSAGARWLGIEARPSQSVCYRGAPGRCSRGRWLQRSLCYNPVPKAAKAPDAVVKLMLGTVMQATDPDTGATHSGLGH